MSFNVYRTVQRPARTTIRLHPDMTYNSNSSKSFPFLIEYVMGFQFINIT